MKEIQCQVYSITSLTDYVYKVLLKPEQKNRVPSWTILEFCYERRG